MINENLHRRPTALDSAAHRDLKLRLPITDWRIADRLNATMVVVGEFSEVCREFPIVFVRAGQEEDGTDAIAPIAVLGLNPNQNLYLDGSAWRGHYVPAILRAYPFCVARMDPERFAICIDMDFDGVGTTEGQPLFESDGKPTPLLAGMQTHLENLETEIQRTRAVGRRLLELGLLQDMRFDATLPDGSQHTVDGFLTIDEKKANELPDAVVCELHRNGLLGLIHLHWVSMGNMRRLAAWHAEREAAKGAVPVPAPAA